MAVNLLVLASRASAVTYPWEAGVSFYTESGDYGTDSKVTTVYIPFSLRRYFEAGDLQLVIPSISQTSEGQVVVVNGVPNPRGRGGGPQTITSQVTHSGIGDILFKGRYYAISERDYMPQVDAIAEIKFPTASRADGLGTGEFDEGLSLDLTKTIETRYLALGQVGYTFIGSPAGESLHNQWHYALGPGYYIIPKKLLGSVEYEEYAALVSGDSHPRDLFFNLAYRALPRLRLEAGVLAGLSTSSAAYGFNLGVKWKFEGFSLPDIVPKR